MVKQVQETICVSVASYRDPDLIKTIKSCIDNAKHPDRIYFSIFSQAKEDEHPDLSFINLNNINYQKVHWSESLGACWARSYSTKNIRSKYILQIDSHSRFKENWDEMIVSSYKKSQGFWGDEIIVTNYPDPFEIDWKENKEIFTNYPDLRKTNVFWDSGSKMLQVIADWGCVVNKEYGDEVFFISANSLFCLTSIFEKIPYDKELYFTGEEPSLALRAYTRGIKIVSPTFKYMYTNYNRENQKRKLHWEDNSEWWKINQISYKRLSKIMAGDQDLGIYGIGSKELFEEYQNKIGIDLVSKRDEIASM